ncbi:MAG: hypothetical protein QM499_01160 [Flavobacteriaceae bacterium]
MKNNTIEQIQNQLNDINYLLNRSIKTLIIDVRSAGIKIRRLKDNRQFFTEAKTKREIYLCLQAFKEGLFLNIDQ